MKHSQNKQIQSITPNKIIPQRKINQNKKKSTNAKQKKEIKDTLLSWNARQFDSVPHSRLWYIVSFIIIIALLAYGLFLENFLLSIIVILIALLLYLFEKRESQVFKFGVTPRGVFAQKSLYKFSSLESFWIFYQPKGRKELSLKSTKNIVPHIQIPLGDSIPSEVRNTLLQFLPEIEQEKTVIDSFHHVI